MGIFDDQIKLPGVITQVEADYSYGFDPSAFGTTDSEVIIGTAFNGPVGVPTRVYSVEHAAYIFGPVYNSETRKETNLVAGVQDAWDRGCRTIYAVRVSGKEIYKDFNFCVDDAYKLRISSLYPTNTGKKCFMVYNNTKNEEEIRFYKPAERATIAEKRRGIATSSGDVLKTTLKINQDYGLRPEDRLVDLIEVFNNHPNNNVLTMTIVDKDGLDVTSSPDVYGLTIGMLFPGLYLIGHKKNNVEEYTNLAFKVTESSKELPYKTLKNNYFRVLELNTDVTTPYPIYSDAKNKSTFGEIMADVEVTVSHKDMFSFLEVAGTVNKAYPEDKFDYEETQLSSFELYKRLGSGYALTAVANKREKTTGEEVAPRVTDADTSDPNRVIPITEGIYSMLEDAEIKYRAVVCVNADEKIIGKLPKPEEFKKATAKPFTVLEDTIEITPVIDEKDFTDPNKYKVILNPKESILLTNLEEVYTDRVFTIVHKSAKNKEDLVALAKDGKLGEGQLLQPADETKVYRIVNNALKILKDKYTTDATVIVDDSIFKSTVKGELDFATEDLTGTDYKGKKYVLGTTLDTVFVFEVTDANKLNCLGDFKSIFEPAGEEAPLSVYLEKFNTKENIIKISSSLFDNISVSEFVELLNKNEIFSVHFVAKLTESGSYQRDRVMLGFNGDDTEGVITINKGAEHELKTVTMDKKVGYDYNMHIPYATNDNFVRQLAQHCTYTELKTTPTFGFIGCRRLTNTGLSSIAEKTRELVETNFDLYAKTNTGRNMLDRQNMPYPIGKNVSVVFTQYPVYIQNANYRYTSNGAAGYAGMVSTLPLDQSSTHQKIEVPQTDFYCSNHQLNQLTAAGIVTLRRSFTKGLVVTDGVTMAPADSVYRRLSSSRIVGAVEDLIRQACEPFIGKQNHTANRNALKTAIKSVLDKITGTLIEQFDFVINSDPNIMKYSYIEISYQIIPIYEIREIRNTIKVTDRITKSNL